jgi:alkanesulfonate monooxygenase SsuD/methylene tetrahydromethanopterin reductase-like flavin-dependent oxidoreductase (luciferase family)
VARWAHGARRRDRGIGGYDACDHRCLPIVRGPIQTAKTLAAIDILSGGRLVVGVGPGSSPRDYAAIGLDFEERWKRFDEAIITLRSLPSEDAESFEGTFYSTEDLALEPLPTRREGPPIWIGSWGSPAGLRRVARLGDGWLASGYNTTPPGSVRVSPSCRSSSGQRGGARRHSRTGSPRCGST